jgi:hypothetical protein
MLHYTFLHRGEHVVADPSIDDLRCRSREPGDEGAIKRPQAR